MHGDDNKAPAEIAVTTLGHPDDWGSPCVTTQGPGDLKSSFSVFIFDAFFKWIKQHKSENVHALYCKTPNVFTSNAH